MEMDNSLEAGVYQTIIYFVSVRFLYKPEKFRYKIRAKTFVGENIGPDEKVLVTDVKVLVPGCKRTGLRMWE
jgi:hypothetical protein